MARTSPPIAAAPGPTDPAWPGASPPDAGRRQRRPVCLPDATGRFHDPIAYRFRTAVLHRRAPFRCAGNARGGGRDRQRACHLSRSGAGRDRRCPGGGQLRRDTRSRALDCAGRSRHHGRGLALPLPAHRQRRRHLGRGAERASVDQARRSRQAHLRGCGGRDGDGLHLRHGAHGLPHFGDDGERGHLAPDPDGAGREALPFRRRLRPKPP